MKKKNQHLIPNCYLKAWCDPTTPDGQEPYIWVHPAEGGEPRRKSPRKSFTETDRYTIQSPDGNRNLRVEDTLADIETKFVAIREKLEEHQRISPAEHFLLCAFVAAMSSRTKAAGDQMAGVWESVRSQAKALAKDHGSELDSEQLDDAVRNANANLVEATIQVVTPMLFRLHLAMFYAQDRGAFITSDIPCVWYDPDMWKRPPAYRSPALCYPNVKLFLSLSPKSLLMLGHNQSYVGYRRADKKFIDAVNRHIRFSSHEYFVTQDGHTNPFWFEEHGLPADAWENTEEGKAGMAQAERYKKMREQYEATEQTRGGRGSRGPGFLVRRKLDSKSSTKIIRSIEAGGKCLIDSKSADPQ